MTLRSAEDHYREQARLAAVVGVGVAQLWRRVTPADVNAWRALLPRAVRLVGAGQYAAARGADGYVSAALAEQGVDVPVEGRVRPSAFIGMSNDGVPVGDLLDLPRVRTLEAVAQGSEVNAALLSQGQRLSTYAVSLVQDAGRQADSAAITARPRVGWVRMVNPPCCERCAVLAGKWFRSNDGFQRHPRCDCRHVPAPEDAPGDIATDPKALFESGQVQGLTKGEQAAIADGADPAQVVNARRGRRADKMTTAEGTTRRGVAGQARRAAGARGARPTPDAIYRYSRTRGEALDALRVNGYIL